MGINHGTQRISDEQLKDRTEKLHGLFKAGVKTCEVRKDSGSSYYDEKITKNPLHLFRLQDAIRAAKLILTADLGADELGQKITKSPEKRPPWTHPDLTLDSTLKETFGLNLLHAFHRDHCDGYVACNFSVPALQKKREEEIKEEQVQIEKEKKKHERKESGLRLITPDGKIPEPPPSPSAAMAGGGGSRTTVFNLPRVASNESLVLERLVDENKKKDSGSEKEEGVGEEKRLKKIASILHIAQQEDGGEDEVIVCFRSGSGQEDWKEHFVTNRVDWQGSGLRNPMCCNHQSCVHDEFLQGFLNVQQELVAILETLLKERPSLNIKILGHSFGGAVSTLFAVHVAQTLFPKYPPPPPSSSSNTTLTTSSATSSPSKTNSNRNMNSSNHKESGSTVRQQTWANIHAKYGTTIEHWVFASPKVGNQHFQEVYTRYVSSSPRCRAYHLILDSDIVPSVPAQLDFVLAGRLALIHDAPGAGGPLGQLNLTLECELKFKFTEVLDTLVLPSDIMKDHSLYIYINKMEKLRRQKYESDRIKQEGNEQFHKKNYKEAIDIYTRGIDRDTSNYMLYFDRAAAYIKMKNLKEAMHDANMAVKLDPFSVEALNRKGLLHYMRMEAEKASKCYQRVLQIQPNNQKALEGMAQLKSEELTTKTRRSEAKVLSMSGGRERGPTASSLGSINEEPSVSSMGRKTVGGQKRASGVSVFHSDDASPSVGDDAYKDPLLLAHNQKLKLNVTPSKIPSEVINEDKKLEEPVGTELSVIAEGRKSSEETEPIPVIPEGTELIFYSQKFHSHCQRIQIALLEKGVTFFTVLIHPGKYPKWFSKKTNGVPKIPALEHKHKVMTDDVEMLVFIDAFPGPSLLPKEEKEREKMMDKIKSSGKLYIIMSKFLFNKDPRQDATYKDEFSTLLSSHEKRIALPFWTGDNFTMLDIVYWSNFHRLQALKYYKRFELSKLAYGKIHSWLAKVKTRPIFQQTAFESGSYLKHLEREARPGPLSFVSLFHAALRCSLDTFSERLHAIIGAGEQEEIHDFEVSSIVRHFDLMFKVFEDHIKMCVNTLLPALEGKLGKDDNSVQFAREHKSVRELEIGIKSELRNFAIAKQQDRKTSALYVSEAFDKFKTGLGTHLDEDDKVIGVLMEASTWEEQAEIIRTILSMQDPETKRLCVWCFKNLPDRASRLQYMRNFNFAFPHEHFSAITEWMESDAGTEFSSIEKNVRKMLAGRDSDTITGKSDSPELLERKIPLITRSAQLATAPSQNSSSNLLGSSGGSAGSTPASSTRSTSVESASSVGGGGSSGGSSGSGGVGGGHTLITGRVAPLGSPTSQSLILSPSRSGGLHGIPDQES